MKIATWNIKRLKHKKQINTIISECESLGADIFILTETDTSVKPDFKYFFQTELLQGITEPVIYNDTESRVSIFTNYEIIKKYPTFDPHTSICIEVKTEKGNLVVYGTIIGVLGNRRSSYLNDLHKQLDDINNLLMSGKNVCIAGDFNCSFSDNYYFTNASRKILLDFFESSDISILTVDCSECIDHIAISKSFVGDSRFNIYEWNVKKELSDHKGIMVCT